MFTYEMTKDFTNAKVKAAAKADIMTLFIEFLTEKFGEEKVKMVRTGNGDSKTNEIGVQFGTVKIKGEEVPLVFTANPSIKEFEDRQTAKKSYVAFDFDFYANAYEKYLTEKAEKAANAKASK